MKEYVPDSHKTNTKTPAYLFYESEDINESEATEKSVFDAVSSLENYLKQPIPDAYEANEKPSYTWEELESEWRSSKFYRMN